MATATMEPPVLPASTNGAHGKAPDLASAVEKSSFILNLELKKPGKSGRADMELVEVEADKTMLRLAKDLFDSKEFGAVASFDVCLRNKINTRYASPSRHLRGGMYRISNRLFGKVMSLLDSAKAERENLVDEFIRVYPSCIEQARNRLGVLFDYADYPPAEALREKFELTYTVEAGVYELPEFMAQIGGSVYEDEKKKRIAIVEEEIKAVTTGLQLYLADLWEKTAAALTPGPDGKLRRFEATAIENMRQVCEMAKLRNLQDDPNINALCDRILEAYEGKSADDLRKQLGERQKIREHLETAAAQLRDLTKTAPARKYDLSEDD